MLFLYLYHHKCNTSIVLHFPFAGYLWILQKLFSKRNNALRFISWARIYCISIDCMHKAFDHAAILRKFCICFFPYFKVFLIFSVVLTNFALSLIFANCVFNSYLINTKQFINSYIKIKRYFRQQSNIGKAFTALPFSDRLRSDSEMFGKSLLRNIFLLS